MSPCSLTFNKRDHFDRYGMRLEENSTGANMAVHAVKAERAVQLPRDGTL